MNKAQVDNSSKTAGVSGKNGTDKSKDVKNPFMNSIFSKTPQMSASDKESMEMKRYGAANLFTTG